MVASNRRARHDYEIVDSFECGIVLTGSEIKSIRAGQLQLKDAYAEIRRGEVWLNNAHIAPYQFARDGGHDPERPRKLLLHRREIDRLNGKVKEAGLTLVPLSVYLTGGTPRSSWRWPRAAAPSTSGSGSRSGSSAREMDRARGR